MKMYKTLRIPEDLLDALDEGDPEATTIKEVEVVKVRGNKVWIPYPNPIGPDGVSIQPLRYGWFDTRKEAEKALLRFIGEHIEELRSAVRNCEAARWKLIERMVYDKEVANDNQD